MALDEVVLDTASVIPVLAKLPVRSGRLGQVLVDDNLEATSLETVNILVDSVHRGGVVDIDRVDQLSQTFMLVRVIIAPGGNDETTAWLQDVVDTLGKGG